MRDETRPGIRVYSPSGKELAYIKTEIPTNVCFGRGAESRTLYVTAGQSVGLACNGSHWRQQLTIDAADVTVSGYGNCTAASLGAAGDLPILDASDVIANGAS